MNGIVEPEGDEEGYLINQIELEMRKVYVSLEKLYNNHSLYESKDPLENCFISNYYYSSRLLERGLTDDGDSIQDVLQSFEEGLQKELDYLASDLEKLTIKMNEYSELMSSMDRNISNLNAMMEAKKNETTTGRNLTNLVRNIKLRFKKERADLKEIVNALFPENLDIHDLIAQILEHHFTEGSDKYLQLEDSDNITEQIEVLRRTNLFDINPHDPLQIRLADLV